MNGKANHTDLWVSRELYDCIKSQLDSRNVTIRGLREYVADLERKLRDAEDRQATRESSMEIVTSV
jgi:hypothetical protein